VRGGVEPTVLIPMLHRPLHLLLTTSLAAVLVSMALPGQSGRTLTIDQRADLITFLRSL